MIRCLLKTAIRPLSPTASGFKVQYIHCDSCDCVLCNIDDGLIIDVLLRQVDPDLCDFLESQDIQSQLYGMRWARLLLGREFRGMDQQVLWAWDFIFIMSCFLDRESRGFVAASNKKLRGGAVAAAIYGESTAADEAALAADPRPATTKESSPGGRAADGDKDIIAASKSRSATDLLGDKNNSKAIKKVLESLKFVMVAMLVAVSCLL
jgi:hypothetical protein